MLKGVACLALLKILLLSIGVNDHNVGIVCYQERTTPANKEGTQSMQCNKHDVWS
jgi:hypothetical protein